MKAALTWLSRLLSEGDGSPSTKRVLFFIAVVGITGVIIGYVAVKRQLDTSVVDLSKAVLFSTGGAYGVGRIAEATENK